FGLMIFFHVTKNSYATVNNNVVINYTMIPTYTAPKMVYRTSTAMWPSLVYDEQQNLSWRFPVVLGFKYMTRHAKVSICKDYVVLVSKEYITIDFHPIAAVYVDVILNGIEVFELRANQTLNLWIRPILQQRKGTTWLCWWINQNEGKSTRTSLLPDELCRHFSLDEIKAATNKFHDDLVLGKGGFGKVYKGFMD
ncbi:hypothetical protein J1N35_000736, partial [Gossypium stocksii]